MWEAGYAVFAVTVLGYVVVATLRRGDDEVLVFFAFAAAIPAITRPLLHNIEWGYLATKVAPGVIFLLIGLAFLSLGLALWGKPQGDGHVAGAAVVLGGAESVVSGWYIGEAVWEWRKPPAQTLG
jgi:hypothetical protein